MNVINRLKIKVRRRESPFYDAAYRMVRAMQQFHVPVIRGLHSALYFERQARLSLWQNFLRVFYYEPLFKSQCECVGRNLRVIGGVPLLHGRTIRIRIGDNVEISGVTTFSGSTSAHDPVLQIGTGSRIGYQTTIVTGQGVYIGQHVTIAFRVFIAGSDNHPNDPIARQHDLPPNDEDIKSVVIEDLAIIYQNATILKGVRIGKGAIVGAGTVVTKDVPPHTIVAGNPARVVKILPQDSILTPP
jgi:acetyltransferase-like isoleucine patch superfamily enzyme